jgi:hypothetical protein
MNNRPTPPKASILKKFATTFVILLLILIIVACSAAAPATTPAATGNTSAQGTPVPGGFEMPPLTRLVYGTLALEDTDEAVSPEQAATLLPLWQAIQALSASDTTAEAEMAALQNQLKAAYRLEQIAVIEAMPLGAEDIQAIMEDLGLEFGNFGDITPPADFTPGAGGGYFGDGPPGGGGFGGDGPPGGGGFGGAGGFNPQNLSPDELATLQAARAGGGRGGLGARLPAPLLTALVQLLETRAQE